MTAWRELRACLGALVTDKVRSPGDDLLSPVDTAEAFVRGMRWAVWLGASVVVLGGLASAAIRRRPLRAAVEEEHIPHHVEAGDSQVPGQARESPAQFAAQGIIPAAEAW
ncbi:hypothetical protein ACF1GW_00180 [Streptomyces achromogenes]|uniref:hypothetical protein n=1 Tax=Streptomyces achromogenes TaxID=67255 RepID=UPI0037023FC8